MGDPSFYKLGANGMDPGKEPVDGRGQYVETVTERHIRAHRQLAHMRSVLGHFGYDLCRAVIASGMTMEAVAAQHGPVTRLTITVNGQHARRRNGSTGGVRSRERTGGRKVAPRSS